jgi:predicted dienelactone hydrolase
MIRKLTYLTVLFYSLVLSVDVAAQQGYSAGFISLEKNPEIDIAMGLWYPSFESESRRKWGPFQPTFAWDANPASGQFPVIILSHGVTGRYRNHRDTAATLARAGYVVIAPQHTQDIWVGTSKTVAAMEYRVGEIIEALDIAKSHKVVGPIMDIDNIGSIGYSLGSMTVLKAYGVLPSSSHYKLHCDSNHAEDPNFCTVIPWWQKILLWFKETELGEADEFTPTPLPIAFKSIALIAPIGAIFPEDQIRAIQAKTAIYRLGDDDQLTFPFHGEYIYNTLSQKSIQYKTYENVHHYAFISPFPAWLLEEEYIPVALDPKGFDRKSFLKEINAEIAAFFRKSLPQSK